MAGGLVALRERGAVDPRYTWNLASIYPTVDDWRADLKRVEEALPGLESFKGHLGDSAQKLLEWFRAYEATMERVGHTFVYSRMLHDGDTANQEASGFSDQARSVFTRFGGAVAFAEPELLATPRERIEQFMSEEPQLAAYRHYFDM